MVARSAPLVLVALACVEPATTVDESALGSRPGMGAMLSGGGATFRVWAPLASSVWVTGDFNGWGWTALGGEGNGNFSADVAGAVVHQRYRYIVGRRRAGEAEAGRLRRIAGPDALA